MVNAASFLATLTVVFRWRPPADRQEKRTSSDESFGQTILTGLQYAWRERSQRIVLTRSIIWMLCASAFWGLLPLVARRQLDLEATGYGFLVTCFGGGAVLGSFALPRLRRRWPTNYLLIAAVVTFAVMLLVLAWVRFVPLVCVTLGWVGGMDLVQPEPADCGADARAPLSAGPSHLGLPADVPGRHGHRQRRVGRRGRALWQSHGTHHRRDRVGSWLTCRHTLAR